MTSAAASVSLPDGELDYQNGRLVQIERATQGKSARILDLSGKIVVKFDAVCSEIVHVSVARDARTLSTEETCQPSGEDVGEQQEGRVFVFRDANGNERWRRKSPSPLKYSLAPDASIAVQGGTTLDILSCEGQQLVAQMREAGSDYWPAYTNKGDLIVASPGVLRRLSTSLAASKKKTTQSFAELQAQEVALQLSDVLVRPITEVHASPSNTLFACGVTPLRSIGKAQNAIIIFNASLEILFSVETPGDILDLKFVNDEYVLCGTYPSHLQSPPKIPERFTISVISVAKKSVQAKCQSERGEFHSAGITNGEATFAIWVAKPAALGGRVLHGAPIESMEKAFCLSIPGNSCKQTDTLRLSFPGGASLNRAPNTHNVTFR
jgi:hypothetical protein